LLCSHQIVVLVIIYVYCDLLDLFNSFHHQTKVFFSSLLHTCLLLHCLVLLLLPVSEFSSFDETSISVVIFYFADTDRGSTHSSQPHDAYYLLQNIKMENSNSNGGQMKPSIKSADMKEVCHQKTTTNKSSSRARHLVVAKFSKVKPTDAFAKKNESSLLMNN
jgi:hypothetical protein